MSTVTITINKTMVVSPFAAQEEDTIEVTFNGVPRIGIIIEEGRPRVGAFDRHGEWFDLGEVPAW